MLFFLGSGTIGATVVNNGTIKAEGAAGSTVDATTHTFDFIGAYKQSDFTIASGATTTIKFA